MTVQTAPTVFEIPDENLAVFREKIEALSKRSVKLLGAPVGWEITGQQTKTWFVTVLGGKREERSRLYHNIIITTPPIQIAGWTFVATIDHSNKSGNILRIVPNTVESLPEQYRNAAPFCQHCNAKRAFKDTYLLRCDETGDLKQIGRQCTRDFIGRDPKHIASMATFLSEFAASTQDEGNEGDWGTARRYLPVVTFLSHVACMVRHHGWLSKAQASEFNRPTSDLAMANLYPPKPYKGFVPVVHPVSDEDRQQAIVAIEWAKTLLGKRNTSEYEHNIAVLASELTVEFKQSGLIASIIGAYLRAQEREIKRAAVEKKFLPGSVSTYLGAVGERLRGVKARVTGRPMSVGREFPSYLYRFQTDAGQSLVWFSATLLDDLLPLDEVVITGTVKKQEAYKDVKQTTLSRCKVEKIRSPIGERRDAEAAVIGA